MSTVNVENETAQIPPTSSTISDYFASKASESTSKIRNVVQQRSIGLVIFLRTLYGILNVIIIVALICVLISAGLADVNNARETDQFGYLSSIKVSAYHTRNAIIAFAVIVLFLVLADTIIYTTGLIKRFPRQFELIFSIVMLVMAAVLFILGCCSSAWAVKVHDTKSKVGSSVSHWKAIASAVASAVFLFIAMLALIANFALRLFRPIKRDGI